MLTKFPFYHGITRKATISFGALFADMFCVTKQNGKSEKIVKVPLAYAPKDKYIVKMLQSDVKDNKTLQTTLPRASFEIQAYTFDSQRLLNKAHNLKGVAQGTNVLQYTPVPYDVDFALYTYTKTTEDDLQLMEQILPFFKPDLTLSVVMQEEPRIVQDIPLILNSVTKEDDYDGSFEDRRMIISTYTFTMKLNYYGPLKGLEDNENHFDTDGILPLIKRVIVNVNNNKYTAEINPFEANKDDIFEIDESWVETIPRDFDEDLSI